MMEHCGYARLKTRGLRKFGHDLQRAEGYLQTRYNPLPALSVALGVRGRLSECDRAAFPFNHAAALVSSFRSVLTSDSLMDTTNRVPQLSRAAIREWETQR